MWFAGENRLDVDTKSKKGDILDMKTMSAGAIRRKYKIVVISTSKVNQFSDRSDVDLKLDRRRFKLKVDLVYQVGIARPR